MMEAKTNRGAGKEDIFNHKAAGSQRAREGGINQAFLQKFLIKIQQTAVQQAKGRNVK